MRRVALAVCFATLSGAWLACGSPTTPPPLVPQNKIDSDAAIASARIDAGSDVVDAAPIQIASSSQADASATLAESPPSGDHDYGDARSAFRLRFERTPCLGTCPMYEVSVGPHGAVRMQGRVWNGNAWADGCAYGNIGDGGVKDLSSMFAENAYFSLKSDYQGGATDAPSTNITLTDHKRTKTVHHYMAASAPPHERAHLETIESEIDSITGADEIVNDPSRLVKCAAEDVAKRGTP